MEQVDQDSSVMKHPGCSSHWMDGLSELFQVVLRLSSWVPALGRLLARPCVVKQPPGRFSTNVEPEGHALRSHLLQTLLPQNCYKYCCNFPIPCTNSAVISLNTYAGLFIPGSPGRCRLSLCWNFSLATGPSRSGPTLSSWKSP